MQPRRTDAPYPADFIRFLAIVLVILVHCSGFPYRIPGVATGTDVFNWFTADVWAAIGYLGVPLFVMLSGALLLDPQKADEPPRVFFRRRFDRIGIPLLFWSVMYFGWNFFIHGKPLTFGSVSEGVVGGAYYHLWFLYLIIGLYLITPILRVLVKNLSRRMMAYLLAIWFAGTVFVPIVHTFTDFNYNPVMVVLEGWVGYFLLGIYLINTKTAPRRLGVLFVLGLLAAIIGDWLLTASLGESYTGFFHGYLSFNMIIASAALFALLALAPKARFESRYGAINRFVAWVGQNTLPLYLIHMMVLETLQLGLLGAVPFYTGNPLLDVPMMAALTFTVSVLIVYPLEKIPFANKIIG
ncbi:MAG: acyltransferase family protein [Candidatus Bathyarchaeota archaeon]|nr:acyltransferase family protein [Candidatus Bathyarchaeota archaeon]